VDTAFLDTTYDVKVRVAREALLAGLKWALHVCETKHYVHIGEIDDFVAELEKVN